jgi:hypothetical protein
MTAHLIRIWWFPDWGGRGEEVRLVVTVMLGEFFLVHVGFMATCIAAIKEKAGRFLALGFELALILGGGGLVLYLGQNAPLPYVVNYTMVALLRALNAFAGIRNEDPHPHNVARSGAGLYFYLLAVFASIAFPFPMGAILPGAASGRGIWQRAPEQVVGAATVYFFCMTCVELYLWFDARRPRPAGSGAGEKPFAGVRKRLSFKRKKAGGQQAKGAVETMPPRPVLAGAAVLFLGLALWMLFYAPLLTPFLIFGAVFLGVFSGAQVIQTICIGAFVLGMLGIGGFVVVSEVLDFFRGF